MNTNTSTMSTTEGKPALPLLRRCQAAAYVRANWGIPCAARTLAKLMTVGGGPLVRKAGRIPLYEKGDLDAWAASKLSRKVRSTSDIRPHDDAEPSYRRMRDVGR
jgi:hypothetical protein